MPARIGHLEREHLVNLLAGLHLQRQRLAICGQQSACAFIERECGIDELAAILEQVVDAVDAIRGLLAARQRHDDVAPRLEVTLLLQPDHQVEEHRGHRLVVGGAAAVEEAVFLDQLERIALPVLALARRPHRYVRAAARPSLRDSSRGCAPRCCRRRACPRGSRPARRRRRSPRPSAASPPARTTFVHEPVECEESISTISL